MPNYDKTNVNGETWIRANKIVLLNDYGESPSITYIEEELFNFTDGTFVKKQYNPLYPVYKSLTQENSNTVFDIVDSETKQNSGKSMTYKELYDSLYSLYFHLAKERDRGPRPFASWLWSEETNSWIAPIPKPEDGQNYYWEESTLSWEIVAISQPPAL